MNLNEKSPNNRLKDYLFVALGSAFGLGLSPIAPGSFGAFLGVGIHIFIHSLIRANLQLFFFIGFFLAVCVLHFCLTPWAVNYWKEEDPKNFVLDEVAGYLLVPILFHPEFIRPTAVPFRQVLFFGFILFRVLDIIKVPPARQIDRNLHGGWGILLDDLVSAIYAVIVLYVLLMMKII